MARRTDLQLDITPSGFFAFRTPLLPYEELEQWNAELEAPACLDGDAEALAAAVDRDRQRLRERLRRLIERPEIREALFVASPSLENGLEIWLRDPDSKKGRRAEESLVRYILRMVTRCTPFGLFSGCSVGTFDGENRLRLAERERYRRHTRLDMDYLFALTEDLGRDPELRRQLRYQPNSSLYQAAGRLRYAEARLQDKVRSHHLVAVESADYLERTLERAADGALLDELAQGLVDDDPEVTLEEAQEFVGELVDSQILVSKLSINVSGDEPIRGVIDFLARHDATVAASEELETIRRELAELDQRGIGNAPEPYRQIAATLEEKLPTKVELPRLFQVDMIKPAVAAGLGQAVVDEVVRGVALLHRLAGRPPRENVLQRFCQDFVARYEEARVMPLAEVLDEEVGIGFDRSRGAEASPLLDGIALPSPPGEQTVPWREDGRLLLRKLETALTEGKTAIELTDKDLRDFDSDDLPPLPDAFQVMAVVAASSEEALAAGDFQVWLRNAGGPSGARLLGRFCHADDELRQHVASHLRAEEALEPEAVFAEIVHLPEGRLGNILFRPVLRDYEIPYLGLSGAPEERQLPLDDLRVAVAGQRIELYSERLGKRIIPRLTSAHNFTARSLGVYRFLCTLQAQGLREGMGWSWGLFENASYLPRVTSGRLVLARARWRVEEKELKKIVGKSDAALYRALQAWRQRRRMPSQVMLVDGDNELLVDFDNVLSLETFVALIKRRPQFVVAEVFPAPDQLWVTGPEGRFQQEIVIPFIRKRQVVTPRPKPATAPSVKLSFAPGSEWLYFKLYTGTATADQMLREVIGPVTRRLEQDGLIDSWFFIRYGDPQWHLRWRLHGDPRALVGAVRPFVEQALAPFIREGRIWRLQVDTYERELDRYGGEHGVELAERLFHADSQAVLEIVDALEGDEGADARWRLALYGTDRLLMDLGFDEPTKLAVARRMQEGFAREFQSGPALKKQLADKLRKERESLEDLLREDRPEDHPLAPGFEIFDRRSEKQAPIVAELAERQEAGRLTSPLTELAPSYVHMFNNRLLRSEGRAHELVLYDFLFRLAQSRAARRRKS